jgi:PKD repeat protein
VYRPASEDIQDVQASVEFTDNDQYAPGEPELWVRVLSSTVATAGDIDGYVVFLPDTPGEAILGRDRDDADLTHLSTFNLSQDVVPNQVYRFVLSAVGTTDVQLSASVQVQNGSTWQNIGSTTYTDSSSDRVASAGTVGFDGATATGRYTFDNFAYAPTGSSGGNTPPTADFTSSCSGLTCNFTSTSSDPDGSVASYSWSFGDGTTSTTQNPSHTYSAAGTYTVALTVTDNDGATGTYDSTVGITQPNQPPAVNAGSNETVLLGVLYTLHASFTDPDNNGPWTYTINWGDGSSSSGSASSQGAITAGHTFLRLLSSSTITVTVTDSAGASGSDSKVVRVVL